jgi:predicted permease
VVGGRGRARVRWGLVLVQVSLSFVLIVGAMLVVQSLQRIRTASPGFATEDVLLTGVNLFAAGYETEQARKFQDELIDRVRAIPGVRSAAYARIPPFSFVSYSTGPIAVDGYLPPPDEQPTADYDEVGPGYFETLGIPIVAGRGFTRADDEGAEPVAVVNETLAARYWPRADPVGSRLRVKDRWMRVVGVARAAKYSNFLEAPRPFFYVPLRQNFFRQVVLHVRTPEAPRALAAALGQEIRALDTALAPQQVITLREQVDRMTSAQHVAVVLLGAFAGVAVLLSAIGLYGVMSYSVSQGTRELGLRMALGADAADLVRLVMVKGLAVTAAGVVLGVAGAMASTRLLGYLLYGVSPRDPLAFGSALAVMTLAALAACLLPAWRATRTDPIRALRD